MMELTDEQRERYKRHLLIEDIGEEGQKKLAQGSVLVIGTGGLGSPAALYLTAAGVGRLGIADADVVDLPGRRCTPSIRRCRLRSSGSM